MTGLNLNSLPWVRFGKPKEPYDSIKKAIWLYFFLLLFEGALRKWFLPSLANPLLIVRDPVALWLIFITWRRGLLPPNIYLSGMMIIGIVGIITAVLFGHGNLSVALYGARIMLIHFPLIFVIGRIMNREDVVNLGKATLMIAIPMAILIIFQFYSPQSAWVNRGVGGSLEGAGFSGALGFFRPPGTFSFTNGTTHFFSFLTPFIIYFWINPQSVSKRLLIIATGALIISVPFSISRTLLFSICVSFSFLLFAISRKPQFLGKLIGAGMGFLLILMLLNQISIIKPAIEAFTFRFDTATESEGGLEGVLGDRYLGGMIRSITSTDTPFLGYGLGIGTSVGGMLLSGQQTFLIYSEDEWARLIGEMGLLLGMSIIVLRVSLCMNIGIMAYKSLIKGDLLPWLLLSFGLLIVPQGQWMQPTSLGFGALIGGLMIASFRTPKTK